MFCVSDKLCKAGSDFDFFVDLKEDITLHKICGWKLEMEIENGIANDPLSDRLKLVLSRDMLNFYLLEKGLGIVCPSDYMYDFSRKMFLMLYSINEFHCLITFTPWDVEKYVYCVCLFPRLWPRKIWN